MKGLFFITDVHLCGTCSSRVDTPWEAIRTKLEAVVSYCNKGSLALVIGGDLFDTPTVSFELYNGLVEVLSGLNERCFVVWGNHDMLYRSMSNAHKCSLYALGRAGVVEFISPAVDVELDGCQVRLVSELPLVTADVPQVLVYHGFLEIKDGSFTVSQADLLGCTSSAVVLLGHDHRVYDDVVLSNGVRIIRCGSFYRNRRDASCYRGVYGCEVRCVNGVLQTCRVSVPCKAPEVVFAAKDSSTLAAKWSAVNYDELVSLLEQSCVQRGMSFDEAVCAVSLPQEVDYILKFR